MRRRHGRAPTRAAGPPTCGPGSPSRSASRACASTAAAVDAIADTLGQDLGRLRGLLDVARRRPTAPAPGSAPTTSSPTWARPAGWRRGTSPTPSTGATSPGAVEVLHRIHPANHALVVMATLHNHFSGCSPSTAPSVRSEKEAAALLGMKGSTFPAKKALRAGPAAGLARRCGQAIELLAQADLDLRGGKHWPDELVLEVLVARLANLARRVGRPAGAGDSALVGAAALSALGQPALAAGGGVLVDDALGGGLVDALLGQAGGVVGVLGALVGGGDGVLDPGAAARSARPCCARGARRSAGCA